MTKREFDRDTKRDGLCGMSLKEYRGMRLRLWGFDYITERGKSTCGECALAKGSPYRRHAEAMRATGNNLLFGR